MDSTPSATPLPPLLPGYAVDIPQATLAQYAADLLDKEDEKKDDALGKYEKKKKFYDLITPPSLSSLSLSF